MIYTAGNRGGVGVNNLPKVVVRQYGNWESSSWRWSRESNVLTTSEFMRQLLFGRTESSGSDTLTAQEKSIDIGVEMKLSYRRVTARHAVSVETVWNVA